MMSPTVVELAKQAESLSASEQIELAMRLLQQVHAKASQDRDIPQWSDVRGMYAYPVIGEDAQDWVNRLRDEWDERPANGK
jgi:hypothetical protein